MKSMQKWPRPPPRSISLNISRKPRQLSGGQRQRVAIGRAIVRNPEGFLFDEPLSNLDAALRVNMRLEIMQMHKDLGATMIYVTHDQVEAMTMADRIVVLNGGISNRWDLHLNSTTDQTFPPSPDLSVHPK